MKHFDTLRYKEELEKAGMTEKSARALTKMNAEFFEEILEAKDFATKTDINNVSIKIDNLENKLKISLLKWNITIITSAAVVGPLMTHFINKIF